MKASRHLPTILMLFLLLLAPLIAHAAPEKRTALVIGNGAYEPGRLKNPVNDATDMAAALKRLGFTVILKTNAKQREMDDAVREFGRSLTRSDVGLFFFAGHGVQVGGSNYLIPVGARIEKEEDVRFEAIDAGRVLSEMDVANNGVNIVLLDACRNNPFARSFRSDSRGLAIIGQVPRGAFISYATAPGNVARDGEGRNSPYTGALLQHMQTPGTPIETVFKRVRQKLDSETGGKQVPWESSSLKGDFYFVPGGRAEERPTPAPSRQDFAMASRPEAPPEDARTVSSPTLGAEFALIPAGTFMMGSPADEKGRYDNETQHQVTISKPFYMQTTEVTQGQWQKVMGSNPSHFKNCGADCPVETVSWNDIQGFIRKLNQLEGTDKYRLPTEAQWEYASRAGSLTAFNTGACLSAGDANYNGNYPQEGCGKGEYREKTVKVGSFAPNAWGLYDMHGNVWEWVQDWHGNYPSGSVTDPEGPAAGSYRVYRGGSWFSYARNCRSALRLNYVPGDRSYYLGFRLLRTR